MEVIELFDRLNESLDTSFPWKWLTPLLERYEISSRVIIISLTSLLGILFPDLVCHLKKMEEQGIFTRGKRICWCQREAEVQKKRQSALLREENVEEGQEHQWTGRKIFKRLF
ncbi:uncharacterized protein LOC123271409 [Cotesia glomerata]|uniref:Uncharacterized protein n=1 Tax=Cotesia glomerata TaxID=32391 RepID=A0AAV7ISA8_COTGL|nr:uncharacterized protein LOC123271409 [Cotesia glomerata]KAH0557211.1 hypothetical protein KQX54_001695 [Cotesia glomerata]